MIEVEAKDEKARELLERLQLKITPEAVSAVVERVAWRTHAALIEATPVKYTGQTRKSWQVNSTGPMDWEVTNPSKIMLYLEEGTKDHGPVTAKFLYVPLTRDASLGGWRQGMVFGTDYVLAKRVKGITARHIVELQRPVSKDWLLADMKTFISDLIKEP